MSTTIITGSKVRSTRDHHLGTGVVCCVHADYGQATVRFGSFPLPHLMQLADLQIVDEDPRPSRLALAKAALEEARARRKANEMADTQLVKTAFDAVYAAEREAAQPPIPPALLEVTREALRYGFKDSAEPNSVLWFLAKSHGIDPARLRDALEVKQPAPLLKNWCKSCEKSNPEADRLIVCPRCMEPL